MKNRFITIAVPTLALCLVAGQAFASQFSVINSSGETINLGCSDAGSTSSEVTNGSTASLSCNGTASVQGLATSATQYTFSFTCSSGQTQKTTVTAGANPGELSLTHTCASS